MSRITKMIGPDLAIQAGMSAFFVLAQAAAEYGVTTASRMSSAPVRSFQQAVDDARSFVSDHTFLVIVAAVVLFALLRFFFTAPRVH